MRDRTNPSFIDAVKPVFIRLMDKKAEFRQLDICSLNEEDFKEVVEGYISQIDDLEKQVLMAWAESTKDINPGLADSVERGTIRFVPAKYDYLKRVLKLEEQCQCNYMS